MRAGFSRGPAQHLDDLYGNQGAATRSLSATRTASEVTGYASLKVHDFWRVAASTSYDLVDKKFNRQAFGILYEDECYAFSFAYESIARRRQHQRPRLEDRRPAELQDAWRHRDSGDVESPLLKPSF